MGEISFNLFSEDIDRLFVLKDLEHKHDMTGNEYAKELLVRELHRLFPPAPKYDEDGDLVNRDAYRG